MGYLDIQDSEQAVIEREQIQALFDALARRGYHIIGPTLEGQAVAYNTVSEVTDLPIGYTDEQEGGSYRLKKRQDKALFGYSLGPHSWKKFLFPPKVRLWQAKRTESGFQVEQQEQHPEKIACIGVRACELHALAIQDKVFLGGTYQDPIYAARRANMCIIAVNCGQAGNTCFCTSMGSGPAVNTGFDLALTEILEPEDHYFVVQIGTELGSELLAEIPHRTAHIEESKRAAQVVAQTEQQMGRQMDTHEIKELLYRNLEHPRWQEVATRCLSCANCTMVCPTCFCNTVEDINDLAGQTTERWRRWDSCFNVDFSYISGGSIRTSGKSRYRQWMTHKLASWFDQFGTSGCVGCGRCITWCPVGIDITEEVRAIRETEHEHKAELQEAK